MVNHMVEHTAPTLTARGTDDAALDRVFRALADPTRRAMLGQLAERERSVGELAAPLAMSLAAASKHVKVLEDAGLLQREVRGRVHVCRLDARPMHGGAEWLRHYERFWNARLDRLAALLEAEDAAADRPAADPVPDAPGAGRRPTVPTPAPRAPRKRR